MSSFSILTYFSGQGIPTGQAGHLLVKTENGQYQIVKVGGATTAGVASSPQVIRTVQRTATVQAPSAAPTATPASVPAAVVAASSASTATTSSSSSNNASAGGSSGGGASGGGSGGMGGTQMTPDTAKHKCKNFLATLLKLASEQPPNVSLNVRQLIQGLIDGKVDPETFTTKLQRELNSSPQPCLVPFLKRSLPYLQQSLINGELSIDGVRAPPKNIPLAIAGMNKGVTTVVQRPQVGLRAPTTTLVRTITPGGTINSNIVRTMTPKIIQQPSKPPFMQAGASAVTNLTNRSALGLNALNNVSPMMSNAAAAAASMREKKSSNSYSVTGDEDINDVAAMGGVNLAEESQRMQGGLPTGTQIRSCKDETFLLTGLLHKRVAKICLDHGLEEPPPEVIALVSHATQDRLKTLLEKLSVISEHRLDIVKQEGEYEVSQDVRGQLRFLGELDKIERRRHEEAERELLLRAAKSRTKTEDPEKEKLKAKAKELQRIEEEQLRHEKANNTALMAIGGPRKKFKLDEDGFSSAASSSAGGSGGAAGGFSSSFTSRPRMKRVHIRDLMFLMEQEKELKRSPLLWKAHCS